MLIFFFNNSSKEGIFSYQLAFCDFLTISSHFQKMQKKYRAVVTFTPYSAEAMVGSLKLFQYQN